MSQQKSQTSYYGFCKRTFQRRNKNLKTQSNSEDEPPKKKPGNPSHIPENGSQDSQLIESEYPITDEMLGVEDNLPDQDLQDIEPVQDSIPRLISEESEELINNDIFQSRFDISVALSNITSKHNLTNDCLRELLLIMHVVKQFPSISIPRSAADIQIDLGLKEVPAQLYYKCKMCSTVISHSLWSNPFGNIKCCGQQAQQTNDHFFLFDLALLFRLTLPSLKLTFERHLQSELSNHQAMRNLKSTYQLRPQDLTLTLNTDGAPIFKSSSSSLWPILAQVNEASSRMRNQNILLLGLWIGKKPNFEDFLDPLTDQLLLLQKSGFHWMNGDEKVHSRVYCLNVMCDSMARPAVQNMHQFNGGFGCPYCYIKNQQHYYPYQMQLELRNKFTHFSDVRNIKEGDKSFIKSRGVKGKSYLECLTYFDCIEGFPPDVMHAVFLGVCRQITRLWFDSKNHKELFYIQPDNQRKIDKTMKQIKPPYRISRTPRSIVQNISHYKAHEWEVWLFYYSPMLIGVQELPQNYVTHWLCLVMGVALLMKSKISENSILRSKECIERFCLQIGQLYGRNQETFNVHLLRHLPYYAEKYGPLQHFSLYPFENYNMTLAKYVNGSQHVGSQIAKRYLMDALNAKQKIKLENDNPCLKMLLSKSEPNSSYQVGLKNEGEIPRCYARVKQFGKLIIHSFKYTKPVKRSSYIVLTNDNHVMEIKYFMVMGEPEVVYCLGMCFEITRERKLWYLLTPNNNYKACIKLDNIVDIVMKINNPIYKKVRYVQFINNLTSNSS